MTTRPSDQILRRARIFAVRDVLFAGYPLADVQPDIGRFGLLSAVTERERALFLGTTSPTPSDGWACCAGATLVWALGLAEFHDLADIDAIGLALDVATSVDDPEVRPVTAEQADAWLGTLVAEPGVRGRAFCEEALRWYLDDTRRWPDHL